MKVSESEVVITDNVLEYSVVKNQNCFFPTSVKCSQHLLPFIGINRATSEFDFQIPPQKKMLATLLLIILLLIINNSYEFHFFSNIYVPVLIHHYAACSCSKGNCICTISVSVICSFVMLCSLHVLSVLRFSGMQ